ncbi:type II toxin-antitoxin system VapC family toxin [Sphingomonas sp.]|uniref:type II toxin-antitoxin system VapC family toxin n=1 Tax=Sphingomonas sp. TaxID=28214 RepID=UPI0035C80E00
MIIDASVATKWFLPEEGSDVALSLVATERLRAPPLLLAEVGDALWKKFRRGELHEQFDLLARHADLDQIVEIVEDAASALATRALELALMLDHAIYDCVYLALAEADDDVLVTSDDAFRLKVERTSLARFIRALGT